MTALDEIHGIENRIHDRIKVLDESKLKLAKTEEDIKKLSVDIVGLESRIKLHVGNLRHMKAVADHVDLNEFAHSKKHLDNAMESLTEARNAVKTAQKEKARFQERIARSEEIIAESKKLLGTYGQVRDFPTQ